MTNRTLIIVAAALIALAAGGFFLINTLFLEGYRAPAAAPESLWAQEMAKDIEALHDLVQHVDPVDAARLRPVVTAIRERYTLHADAVAEKLDPLLKVRLTTYREELWPLVERWMADVPPADTELSKLKADLKVQRKILLLAAKRIEKESLAETRVDLLRYARIVAGVFGLMVLCALFFAVTAWRGGRRLEAVAKRIGAPAADGSELMTHAERIGGERVSTESADRKELARERTILKRYRDILDSLQAGIIAADAASGRILFVNTLFRDWFGAGPELIGEPVSAIVAKSGVDIALPGKLPHTGRTYWRDVTTVAGTVLYVVRDISEQERLASRLLNSERLISIGEMASKVTHEIRNPLSTVKLNAEYIADNARTMTPDELASSIALIVKEVVRLEEITDRYMGMVRYRADEEPAHKTLLPEALGDLLKFHEGEFKKRNIMLQVTGLPDAELAIALNSFREVMLNLLKNAWEELGDGGCVVLSGETAGGMVQLFVDDSGHGVPAAEREKIFRNFYTTKPGGTGIGLSHSLKLVTEAGGTIAVEDSPLGGARFVVTVPRVGAA